MCHFSNLTEENKLASLTSARKTFSRAAEPRAGAVRLHSGGGGGNGILPALQGAPCGSAPAGAHPSLPARLPQGAAGSHCKTECTEENSASSEIQHNASEILRRYSCRVRLTNRISGDEFTVRTTITPSNSKRNAAGGKGEARSCISTPSRPGPAASPAPVPPTPSPLSGSGPHRRRGSLQPLPRQPGFGNRCSARTSEPGYSRSVDLLRTAAHQGTPKSCELMPDTRGTHVTTGFVSVKRLSLSHAGQRSGTDSEKQASVSRCRGGTQCTHPELCKRLCQEERGWGRIASFLPPSTNTLLNKMISEGKSSYTHKKMKV